MARTSGCANANLDMVAGKKKHSICWYSCSRINPCKSTVRTDWNQCHANPVYFAQPCDNTSFCELKFTT